MTDMFSRMLINYMHLLLIGDMQQLRATEYINWNYHQHDQTRIHFLHPNLEISKKNIFVLPVTAKQSKTFGKVFKSMKQSIPGEMDDSRSLTTMVNDQLPWSHDHGRLSLTIIEHVLINGITIINDHVHLTIVKQGQILIVIEGWPC